MFLFHWRLIPLCSVCRASSWSGVARGRGCWGTQKTKCCWSWCRGASYLRRAKRPGHISNQIVLSGPQARVPREISHCLCWPNNGNGHYLRKGPPFLELRRECQQARMCPVVNYWIWNAFDTYYATIKGICGRDERAELVPTPNAP